MKKTILFCSLFALLLSYSCKKNQLDGNATIQGNVLHHSKLIPYTRVFIKFKSKDFPGVDTTQYDAKVQADASGHYTIKCYKGDYYLYGIGYDDQLKADVKGGLAIHIRNKETVNTDLAVTE